MPRLSALREATQLQEEVNYPCLKAGTSGIGREDRREASIERDCALSLRGKMPWTRFFHPAGALCCPGFDGVGQEPGPAFGWVPHPTCRCGSGALAARSMLCDA